MIIRKKTLDKKLEQSYERGKQDGMDSLIAMIKIFAKEGDGKYYFGPVQTDHLTVEGNVFYMKMICGDAVISGNFTGGTVKIATSLPEGYEKSLEAIKGVAKDNPKATLKVNGEYMIDAAYPTISGECRVKRVITKEEFEKGYIERSHITREFYDQNFVTLPCPLDCDAAECEGWATIHNDPEIIKDHLRFHAPKSES
jgi:hypothetical protein